MYLNKINLGNRSYGIATAAQNYYGKELKDLTLPEVAMLAGLPKAPNNYDPTKKENVQKSNRKKKCCSKFNEPTWIYNKNRKWKKHQKLT